MFQIGKVFLIGVGVDLQVHFIVGSNGQFYRLIDDGNGLSAFEAVVKVFDIFGKHTDTSVRGGMADTFRPDSGMNPVSSYG